MTKMKDVGEWKQCQWTRMVLLKGVEQELGYVIQSIIIHLILSFILKVLGLQVLKLILQQVDQPVAHQTVILGLPEELNLQLIIRSLGQSQTHLYLELSPKIVVTQFYGHFITLLSSFDHKQLFFTLFQQEVVLLVAKEFIQLHQELHWSLLNNIVRRINLCLGLQALWIKLDPLQDLVVVISVPTPLPFLTLLFPLLSFFNISLNSLLFLLVCLRMLCVEYLLDLLLAVCLLVDPCMAFKLLDGQSFFRVQTEHSSHQIDERSGGSVLSLVAQSLFDETRPVYLWSIIQSRIMFICEYVCSWERRESCHKTEQNNTQGKEISLIASILSMMHLWSHVGHRSDRVFKFIGSETSCETKINDLNVTVQIDENVLRLEISMGNPIVMHVLYSTQHGSEERPCRRHLEPLQGNQIVIDLPCVAILHDGCNIGSLLSCSCLIDSIVSHPIPLDDVGVIERLHNFDLLLQTTEGHRRVRSVEFDGEEIPIQLPKLDYGLSSRTQFFENDKLIHPTWDMAGYHYLLLINNARGAFKYIPSSGIGWGWKINPIIYCINCTTCLLIKNYGRIQIELIESDGQWGIRSVVLIEIDRDGGGKRLRGMEGLITGWINVALS